MSRPTFPQRCDTAAASYPNDTLKSGSAMGTGAGCLTLVETSPLFSWGRSLPLLLTFVYLPCLVHFDNLVVHGLCFENPILLLLLISFMLDRTHTHTITKSRVALTTRPFADLSDHLCFIYITPHSIIHSKHTVLSKRSLFFTIRPCILPPILVLQSRLLVLKSGHYGKGTARSSRNKIASQLFSAVTNYKSQNRYEFRPPVPHLRDFVDLSVSNSFMRYLSSHHVVLSITPGSICTPGML
ncbi:hypothetical protein EYC84_007532 [Monilinia fructicola]|uniref:Uncharacterized protein n=1 Tax=Monilinia fructicola TaxID=38448 RepID=A0A5M9JGI9_MONFR|nr:hypothetical protein EYC84_007532 [Monilinia fructicola]